MFEIYKQGQGLTARVITALGLGALAVFGCFGLYEYLQGPLPDAVPKMHVVFWALAIVGAVVAVPISRKIGASLRGADAENRPGGFGKAFLIWAVVFLAVLIASYAVTYFGLFRTDYQALQKYHAGASVAQDGAAPAMPELSVWSRTDVSLMVSGFCFVLAALGIAWVINWPRFVDYLIVSEMELRKVSWPTRAELKRQTAVVIFTIFFFAFILLVADLIISIGSKAIYKF